MEGREEETEVPRVSIQIQLNNPKTLSEVLLLSAHLPAQPWAFCWCHWADEENQTLRPSDLGQQLWVQGPSGTTLLPLPKPTQELRLKFKFPRHFPRCDSM